MKYTLIGELPRHIYCFVDSAYTHKEDVGLVPCVWFGLVSYPGRLFGCNVMLESGAVYRNVPVHAIAFDKDIRINWTEQDAQKWDCYSYDFTTIEYSYLKGLDCKVKSNGKEYEGEYLFTVTNIGDGFSAQPEQAKEFTFVKLDNGALTIQPTDFIIFRERSFTDNKLEFPTNLKRQTKIYTTE